jgi:hypothetical protein
MLGMNLAEKRCSSSPHADWDARAPLLWRDALASGIFPANCDRTLEFHKPMNQCNKWHCAGFLRWDLNAVLSRPFLDRTDTKQGPVQAWVFEHLGANVGTGSEAQLTVRLRNLRFVSTLPEGLCLTHSVPGS